MNLNSLSIDYSYVALAMALLSLVLHIMATRNESRLSIKQEKSLNWLNCTRLVVSLSLSASQAALVAWHASESSLLTSPRSLIEMAGAALWTTGSLVLSISWRQQGALPLLLPSLFSLLFSATLLASVFEEQVPAIASTLVHTAQTILMLTMVILELAVSHQVMMAMESGDNLFEAKVKDKKKKNKPRVAPPSRWKMAASSLKYIVPTSRSQTFRLLSCFGLLAIERVVSLAVPILFKHTIDSLSHLDYGSLRQLLMTSFWGALYPWAFLYLVALFIRGGSDGLLSSVRDITFIPVNQSAFRRVSLDVFGHLLALDHRFHSKRKTGQIMRILDRGTSSIQDIATIRLFNVLPQILDIAGACTYLALALDSPWISIIVLFTIGLYIPVTLVITERRGAIRKAMNNLDSQKEGRVMDVLLNYDTVKLFGAEQHELDAYDQSIRSYQAAEYWQLAFVIMLSILQSTIIWSGSVGGIIVAIHGLVDDSMTLGDLVLFLAIIQQLYVPLTQFGSFYRSIQKALVDLENMFDLLATQPQICDPPQGPNQLLATGAASVVFDYASFAYKPSGPRALKDISFHLPEGKTLAIVGSTGSGKSTIIKLLLRFYDVTGGSVMINGQDVRSVSLGSLRRAIGVVPQDVLLFNATISDNIKYGKMDASDKEVVEASELAAVHDSIVRLKKGFQTTVGERGVRLSGGEKQRVGMARALIKKPSILVLDEATSSVDSITEMIIQSSLSQMQRHSLCTTVIVAHRLSTIIDADAILVLDKGEVAQYGTHSDLINDGIYHSLWSHQVHAQSTNSPDGQSIRGGASDDEESDFGGGGGLDIEQSYTTVPIRHLPPQAGTSNTHPLQEPLLSDGLY